MRLFCLSLALAIIYIIAIVHDSGVEARAAASNKSHKSSSEEKPEAKPSEESSSSSSEDMSVPAKPAGPEQTVEAFALGIPTVLGGLYWTELAFDTMYNNSMHIADKMDLWPAYAAAVKEYILKSVTW